MNMLDTIASSVTKVFLRFWTALVAMGILTFFVVSAVHAAELPQTGLAVSPHTFELAANPGETLKNSLRVDNLVDIPLEVTVSTRNFTALGEEGGIDLSPAEDDYSLAAWTTVSPAKITIPARESRTFEYAINIPQNATPGGRFGSIIFQTAPTTALSGGTGVAISQEVGALVFVKIAGEVAEKATIVGFESTGGLKDGGPVNFDLRVKNEGNVHVKPKGTITISNLFGQKIATVPVDGQNVLPGAVRKIDAAWDSGWLFGRYNATLSLVYGKDNQVITASTAFWGFPYKLAIVVLVIAGVLTLIIFPRRARIWRAIKILLGKE